MARLGHMLRLTFESRNRLCLLTVINDYLIRKTLESNSRHMETRTWTILKSAPQPCSSFLAFKSLEPLHSEPKKKNRYLYYALQQGRMHPPLIPSSRFSRSTWMPFMDILIIILNTSPRRFVTENGVIRWVLSIRPVPAAAVSHPAINPMLPAKHSQLTNPTIQSVLGKLVHCGTAG
ncbi:hypothetical protein OG21DRAFT_812059 [Imleria badia]|nr:hypothetical protein OG21DRAFT_812059 [Imleria badia]